MTHFDQLGVSETLCALLKKQGITEPTPVQEQAIPPMRAGRDVIAQAQTGTGKTLAFLLPLLAKIKPQGAAAQALVIAPTRELAIQIARVAEPLGAELGIGTIVIYGGADIERQKEKLRRHPQLVIGTPGRLLDHVRRGTLALGSVNKIVLDEADEMLKMGFIEDVETLLDTVAQDYQLALFSATLPERIVRLTKRFMTNPAHIRIEGERTTLSNVEQVVLSVSEGTKLDRLCASINEEAPYLAMVFCATKERTRALMMELARRGYLVDALSGDLTQTQRGFVLRQFREAKLQILCATDIAARGLDIEGVTHVYNYDLPPTVTDYIHRIGRTGRAGAAGKAITLVAAHQHEKLRKMEAALKERLRRTAVKKKPRPRPNEAGGQAAVQKGRQKRSAPKSAKPKPRSRKSGKTVTNIGRRSRKR
ncbi:DEAD/DEAH box helicase [Selenomonas sp. oral taxon 138]|uniref:DEAD/DEAH box helicase n=1 Tax=Selenomonas sp. oral taxon 138 TaxID=712532 RepID=UPI0002A26798|nr:DEAD/DEAH box helicase [Selenomonas sp. oral taxon 138]EKX96573.1 DEAD-box ATP-dependent RNA helicase CshA family protein [Selenomonas sp. oral taxon 138 str. F0429]